MAAAKYGDGRQHGKVKLKRDRKEQCSDSIQWAVSGGACCRCVLEMRERSGEGRRADLGATLGALLTGRGVADSLEHAAHHAPALALLPALARTPALALQGHFLACNATGEVGRWES